MLGGYQQFGYNVGIAKLTELPPHYAVRVAFNFFRINIWESGEDFVVFIDGVQAYRGVFPL